MALSVNPEIGSIYVTFPKIGKKTDIPIKIPQAIITV